MAKGGNASKTTFTGSPETFQGDSTGTFTYSSFPTGWSDVAQVDPESLAPKPSAVVIKTTDADGHSTNALATLPGVAESQGIYRPIDPTTFYMTRADVRVDQFGDTDPSGAVEDPNNPGFFLCGCPLQSINLLDWPMQVSFANIDGSVDPAHAAAVGVAASSQTHTWHLFDFTTNIAADIDLNVPVVEGQWYGVETDFNQSDGALHGTITDPTGKILADKLVFITAPQYALTPDSKYDPKMDGVFNTEAYFDSELTLVFGSDPTLNKPGLAVIDNIDATGKGHGNAFAFGHDQASKFLDSVWSDHG